MKVTESKVKKFLYSMNPQEYIHFMKDVHFHCPFKTKALTNEIITSWKTDQPMKSIEFNEIRDKREEEHLLEAQEKRQRDLRRIQDMNSKSGLNPLQLFTKEIWSMILDEVMPEDKRNFREVHETFRDLTEDTLIGDILFPMILGFKEERFWGDDNGILPNLRLVSKSLRNAMDRWYEEDIRFNLHKGNKKSRPSKVISFNLKNNNDYRRIKKMKEDLCDPSSSKPQRFYTRSLAFVSKEEIRRRRWRLRHEIDSDDEDDDANNILNNNEFTGNIDAILDHVGDQIWYFSFEFHSSYSSHFWNCYTSLLGWLSKMPNLKWLRIYMGREIHYMIPAGLLPPTLKHLERMDLELEELNAFAVPVFCQILSVNTQVKTLNLLGLKYLLKQRNSFLNNKNLTLEALGFDGRTATPRNADAEDNDRFDDTILVQSIPNTTWPLKKIDWTLSDRNAYSIFRELDKLLTLEEIRLLIRDIGLPDDTEDIAFLKLPQLTHFELKFDHPHFQLGRNNHNFFFAIQFLLYAKKLQSLTWKCDMLDVDWKKLIRDVERATPIGEMIEFEGGMCDFSVSNIWRVFPWLDIIKLELINSDSDSGRKIVAHEYRRRDMGFF